MAAPPRGRGYAMNASSRGTAAQQPLRQPGESGLRQRFGDNFTNMNKVKDDKVPKLCNRISEIALSDPKKGFEGIEVDVLALCSNAADLESFVDGILSFALRSKCNSHVIALFCEHYIHLSIEGVKLRTLLLRKLQSLYKDKNKTYLTLDKFLLDVTFLCEIYYHVKIDGNCIQVLTHPLNDYLGMLLDGSSQNEIETFVEQFPKCFKNIKANDPNGLDNLLIKIRKQIVAEGTISTVRSLLLEILESILTDWKPSDQSAKHFYESLSKPVVRLCQ